MVMSIRRESLLSRKVMDGPRVPWTVADLFKFNDRAFMVYHAAGSGYDFMTPVGATVGGALYLGGYRPYPTALSMMGTSGLVAGGLGAACGLALLANAARKGEANTPVPWTDEHVQMRVSGLSHNFMVRVMDLSVWSGLGVAAGLLLLKGGPPALAPASFSPGALGTLQLLSLGAAAGGLGGIACASLAKRKEKKDLEVMDEDDDDV